MRTIEHYLRSSLVLLGLVLAATPSGAQQMSDPEFDTSVPHPAYPDTHPRVLFDEYHHNFHKSTERYKPFADLITNDGYEVTPGTVPFSRESLKGYGVLVISNARPMHPPTGLRVESAFTPQECDAVRDWVRGGGALLLIADHWPLSAAAGELARRFGVEVSTLGFASDSAHSEPGSGDPSRLVFTRENGLLRDHPLTRGRDAQERLERVVSFTGQSLRGPEGSVAFLALGPEAIDEATDDIMGDALNEIPEGQRQVPVGGRAQGLAFPFGKGRVVVLGEAAMLTAQRHGEERFGMNMPGNQDRQLALNIMHWLSGLLPR